MVEIGRERSTHEVKNAYRILVGNTEGKRQVVIPTRKRDDNIKMIPKETEWNDIDQTHLLQDRGQRRPL
jgi:hypothetical protein